MFQKKIIHILLALVLLLQVMPVARTGAQNNLANRSNVYVNFGNLLADNQASLLYDNIEETDNIADAVNLGEASDHSWFEYEFTKMIRFNKIRIQEYQKDSKADRVLIQISDSELLDEGDELQFETVFDGSFDADGCVQYISDELIIANRVKVTVLSYKEATTGDIFITECFVGLEDTKAPDENTGEEPIEVPDAKTPVGSDFLLLQSFDIPVVEAQTVTRGLFASYMTKLMRVDPTLADTTVKPKDIDLNTPHYWDIQYLFNLGYLTPVSAGKIEPNAPITIGDASSVLLKILGYGNIAGSSGNLLAGQATSKLLRGMDVPHSARATASHCYRMMVNALEIDMVKAEPWNDKITVQTGETLLKNVWNLYTLTAQLTETPLFSITGGKSTLPAGRVRLDSTVFETGGLDLNSYPGYNLKIYYEYTNNTDLPVIKAFAPKTEDIIHIKSGDILSADLKKIEYLEEGKTKTLYLSGQPLVLLNNKIPVSIGSSTLMPQNGELVVVDNFGFGYDLILVKEGVDYLVNSTGKDFLSFQGESLLPVLTFNLNKDKVNISKGGKTITLAEIAKHDMVTIYADKFTLQNGIYSVDKDATLYDIVVSSQRVEGTITEIGEDAVVIGDKSYEVTKKYLKTADFAKKVGQNATFYLNSYGKIAASGTNLQAKGNYGYAYQFYGKDGLSPEYSLKIYLKTGHTTLLFADKVSVNHKPAKVLTKELFHDTLLVRNETNAYGFKPQLVKFDLNEEEKISKIHTAVSAEHNVGKTAELELSAPKKIRTYLKSSYTMSNDFLMSANPTIFVVPLDTSITDEKEFATMDVTDFETYKSYITEAFNASEVMLSDLVVVYNEYANAIATKADTAVIKDLTQKLNEDGETATFVSFYEKGILYQKAIATDILNDAAKLKPGMVIQYHKNFKDEIDNINIIFDIDNPTQTNLLNSYSDLQCIYGTITKMNGTAFLFSTPTPGGTDLIKPYQFKGSATAYFVFDCATGRLAPAKITDVPVLEENTLVFIRFYYAQSRDVVVYKNVQS